jgi:hypothetical protein
MENGKDILCGILMALVVITILFSIGMVSELEEQKEEIQDWKNTVDNKMGIIHNLKNNIEYWKNLYLNYECNPEVITEYITVTETVEETIWNNETIYIDNAIYDINRNGIVDYEDACEVLYYLKHGLSIPEDWVFNKYGNPYEKLYDVNRDGNVNKQDVEDIWMNCDA